MNLTLKPELTEFIQQEILTGKYASPEEVIEAALNLLKLKRAIDKQWQKSNFRRYLSSWQATRTFDGSWLTIRRRRVTSICPQS